MRAGKLDRTIAVIRQLPEGDDGFGNVVPGERVTLATLRAQIIQASTEEFIRAYGASSESVIIFRTRWLEDITLADFVEYDGQDLNIVEIKEIGRRRGREIRCRLLGG